MEPNRLQTEVAHILFLDMVGFSRGSMERQAYLTKELRDLVRLTPEFVRATAAQELIGLDTGDGMALVFFRDPLAPLQCAVEVAHALVHFPELKLRSGIHSGPVSRTADLNGRDNVTGSGINTAQRVMDCADAGHILLSSATADMVLEFEAWAGFLHDLGECEVKHGKRVHLYNFVAGTVGRAETPSRLVRAASTERPDGVVSSPPPRQPPAASRPPVAVTRFFGREAEIEVLLSMLDDPYTRLVTLIGPGGCGKTRLAMEAAARQIERFTGAVWFVTLADISDPALILPSIHNALKLPITPGLDLQAQVCAALDNQPSILFLDNFEQIAEPTNMENESGSGSLVVRALMEHVPSLKCVVTSRRILALAGEHELEVRPLPVPTPEDSPEALVRLPSVQLFVDRARSVRPGFQITPANAAAVASLCVDLEGIPLAIELAAARSHFLSPAQIQARMRDKFQLLQTQKRDVPARHRTLEAAIDYSFDLLTDAHRTFFTHLSVFAGGWTADAAEIVCDQPDAFEQLAALRQWSFIIAEDGEAGMRLRMLEILREYARERLPDADYTRLVDRHARYFSRFVQEADSGSMKADLDNIRTAFQTMARESRSGPREESAEACLSAARIAVGVFPILHQMGNWDEALRMLSTAREALDFTGSGEREKDRERTAAAARMAFQTAILLSDLGDSVEANRQAQASLELARRIDSSKDVADAVNLLGAFALNHGDAAEAELRFREALAMRDVTDWAGRGKSLHNLGLLATRRGDTAGAQSLYQEALNARRAADDELGTAETLLNIGVLLHNSGDLSGARTIYQEVLDTYTALDFRWGVAIMLNNLAEIAEAREEFTDAVDGYRQSFAMLRAMGSPHAAAPAASLERLGQRPHNALR
ncbi:MAG: tetratricopeptide repeat protein [Capsulimonadaceae bacterium]